MKALYKSIYTYLVLGVVAAVALAGCDFTEGFDRDPNVAQDAPTELILTGAMVGDIMVHEGNWARVAGIFSGYFTGADRQYSALDQYDIDASESDAMWNLAYTDVIAQTRIVRQRADESGNRVLEGIATVVEAHTFSTLTVLFGDIPFSQSLNFFEFENPEFDAQQDVIAGIHSMLDEAIADLESGQGGVQDADIFYQGDASKWIEAAHTLQARLYLYAGEYEQAYNHAQQGISDPTNNMIAPHGPSRDMNMNVYTQFIIDRSGYLDASNAFARQLITPDDAAFRGHEKTSEAARLDFLFSDTELNTVDGAFAAEEDFHMITYAENQLTLAEIELVHNNNFDAALAELNEVRTALNDLYANADEPVPYETLEADDFEDGGFENPVGALTPEQALLLEILQEKYLTGVGTIQGFNLLRRTENYLGVPNNRGACDVQADPDNCFNEFPQRFIVAQDEINANINAPQNPPGAFAETWLFEHWDYAPFGG